ncbi:hypothetical protein PMG11_03049 [Penicillium brasilianum]|uniref:Uncharacterized protein n=1 Tax=Penicillium brasilianum TaxID=104259 RepID=A0A0F7V8V6_PENBI|nr:hypothetical protein PMG11_03049 [Penicillium brasilianum]
MTSSASFSGVNSGLQVGNNFGPITADLHLPQPPEPIPSPLSTVPFPRDPDFLDRGTVFDDIRDISSSPASRLALVGIGGVGKSQLAIEYCYRFRDESPERWAFWIHASNAARFEQGCQSIAERVKIPGRDTPKSSSLKLLSDWLCDEKREKWLLILDNVDDDEFLHNCTQSNQPLLAQLPMSANGTIIITSRSREVASRLVEDRNIIDIKPMTEKDAVNLFEKKLAMKAEKEAVIELTTALDSIPLAIVQAAAYIKQRAPRCSVQQYLEQFRKGDRKRTRLLEKEGGHLRRDWEAKNSVMVTWHMTFDHLQQTRRSAADLLSLMSFFDRQGIPECCLRHRTMTGDEDNNNPSQEMTDSVSLASSIDDDEFEEDIQKLRSFSLISTTSDPATFEMHRLVQLATRNWLESHGQFNEWRKLFIRNLSIGFPAEHFEHEDWSKCQLLYPHVQLTMTQYPELDDCLDNLSILQLNAGTFAVLNKNVAEAQNLLIAACKSNLKLFSSVHPRTLSSADRLGAFYLFSGQVAIAEKLLTPTVKIHRRLLGDDHPATLLSMSTLGSLYLAQNRWQDAEALYQQVVTVQRKSLDCGNFTALSGAINLAKLYRQRGRLKYAEELLEPLVGTLETALGAEHPETLASMSGLASVYRDQGRYHDAEVLYTQVINTGSKVFGTDHPEILSAMIELAISYEEQGSWSKAEMIVLKVIDTCKKTLGDNHYYTMFIMTGLAHMYKDRGRLQEAESLFSHLFNFHQSVHGATDPRTLTVMHSLAVTWSVIGRDADAQRLMAECVEKRTRVLGPDHPDTKKSTLALVTGRMIDLDIN